MQECLVGVDVSKDTLDIAYIPKQAPLRIGNNRREIVCWLKSLRAAGSCVAMESTGIYHQLLAELARDAGMRVYVLNPKRIWHAARGDGRRGKTDRIDAQVIVKFLHDHLEQLHEWTPGTPLQREIAMLERRRHRLEQHCTAMRMTLRDLSGLEPQVQQLLDSAKAMRQAIDQRIQSLAQRDDGIARGSRLLREIPAIGPTGSVSLATLFERVPFKSSDAVVAYIGIDVRTHDSGHSRGKRRLTKWGPAHLRRLVWLLGFAGAHTKVYKAYYDGLKARGLSFTEAALILGRRILRIAWAVWRSGEHFDPALLAKRP
jgi:transposase